MILTCNSCSKKFVVPDNAITAAGRMVQCGSCGNKWKQFPIGKIKKTQSTSRSQKVASRPKQIQQNNKNETMNANTNARGKGKQSKKQKQNKKRRRIRKGQRKTTPRSLLSFCKLMYVSSLVTYLGILQLHHASE